MQDSSQADNPQGDGPADPAELEASFEPSLSPYGSWTDDGELGRVWVPAPEVVGDSFVPYATNGHWAQTEYGWTWLSGWEWGWAPFHYGRWAHVGGNGPWCWVPGTTWSPGWVAWRSGGGYAGWAALAPRNAPLDPAAWRSSWVFVRNIDLGQPYPLYQPGGRASDLYRRTEPVRETRLMSVGHQQLLVNPGPVAPREQTMRPAPAMVFGPVNQGAMRGMPSHVMMPAPPMGGPTQPRPRGQAFGGPVPAPAGRAAPPPSVMRGAPPPPAFAAPAAHAAPARAPRR